MKCGHFAVMMRCDPVESSLVYFILPISKEASPASIWGRVWCDVSSRTCLAGLNALLHKEIPYAGEFAPLI
jgi:hypothetical protein